MSHSVGISRRGLLTRFAIASSFMVLHDEWIQACGIVTPSHEPSLAPSRIRSVRLQTTVPLKEMIAFYQNKIGLPVKAQSAKEVAFQAGTSLLTFVQVAKGKHGDGGRVNERGEVSGEPMYHFAFNIPENKIQAARDWQTKRTTLVPTPAHMIDSKYSPDVRHFANWNAHSVFFYDPAYNIVEYIARHDLKNGTADNKRFDASDLLGLSEIGFLVEPAEREALARKLGLQLGLREYPRGATPWAMGDEQGLVLVLGNLGGNWGENSPTPVRWGVFPTEATIVGEKPQEFTFAGKPYRVVVE